MRKVSLLGVVTIGMVLLLGCQPEQSGEVLDFSDIVPESEREQDELDETESSSRDSIAVALEYFTSSGLEIADLSFVEERMFPERFGPSSKVKFQFVLDEDTVNYYKWGYRDSVKTMNALYNWIDCFGKKCKSVFLGEARNFQRNPMKIMVNDTALIYIEALEKVDFKIWDAFHDSLGFEKDWNLIIEQGRYGRAKWYIYENEEKKNFEQ